MTMDPCLPSVAFFVAAIALRVVLGFWIYQDANKRGGEGLLWGLVCGLLGLIGLVIYMVMRDDIREPYKMQQYGYGQPNYGYGHPPPQYYVYQYPPYPPPQFQNRPYVQPHQERPRGRPPV